MDSGIVTLIIIIINIVISYKGFTDILFFEKYEFRIDRILYNKEYIRLISSGFLHLNWVHLIFNMVSLFFFAPTLEAIMGIPFFLTIYFTALIGGNICALFLRRNHTDYSTVGASGAVSGVIFAVIALFPDLRMGMMFLPIAMPAWIYGLLYIIYTIYSIKERRDNIGHEAHFGGALAGMFAALLLYPSALVNNYIYIILLTIPCIVFLYIAVKLPHVLIFNTFFFKKKQNYTVEDKYNESRVNKQQEIDRILEKISDKGMGSLTAKERQYLEDASKP